MARGSQLLAAGGVLGATGVLAGAFGAHWLGTRLPEELLSAFRTAASYQVLHAIAVVALAGAMSHFDRRRLSVAGWLLVAGTVVFAGSLYLMAMTGARMLGAITPVGGLLLVAGWITVALGVRRVGGQAPGDATPKHSHE